MIEVKIARRLTREGVDGVRWVLLDPMDAASAGNAARGANPAPAPAGLAVPLAARAAGAPAFAAQASAATAAGLTQMLPAAHSPGQALMLGAVKSLVVVVALAAAVATAWRVIGPPRWGGTGAASGVHPVGPALPAAPASPGASAPVVTAWQLPGQSREAAR